MSELKKCPFCGGDATIQKLSNSTLSFAVCVECRMRTPTLQDGKTAMRVWNTRKPMDNIVRKLEEEKQRLKGLKNDCIALSDSEVVAIEEKAYNFAINIVKQEINNGLE